VPDFEENSFSKLDRNVTLHRWVEKESIDMCVERKSALLFCLFLGGRGGVGELIVYLSDKNNKNILQSIIFEKYSQLDGHRKGEDYWQSIGGEEIKWTTLHNKVFSLS
jgi:hypothetical protein